MKPCKYLSHEHPLRLAHRGSTVLWPENTLTAFQGALDMGCRYIETDVHMTRDRVIVTFHDDTLERVTNGSGRVQDWHWHDLRRLDAAYHFKPEEDYPYRGKGISIPSLEQALTTFADAMFNIDLKQPGIEQAAADLIKRHGWHDRVLIASFKDRRVRRCRRLLANLAASSAGTWETARIWLYSRIGKSFTTPVDAIQVPVHQWQLTVLDEKLVAAVHAAGIQVHAWVVNEPEEMRRLIALGVDGIVTDRIDFLNQVIRTDLKAKPTT